MAERRARPELTLRGRAFLAGGGTTVLCAILLGQTALVRIGVLALVLPGLSWALTRLRHHEVEAHRLVPLAVVPAGAPCQVDLVVRSADTDTLLVEENLPHALGSRPRFVLEKSGTSDEHLLHYVVRSDVRGRFTLGPLMTRTSDPFGLVELRRTVPGTSAVTVTPRIVPLRVISLGGGRTGAGERNVPLAAAGAAEDATVREYRRGDDLRRVHWRSSARVGELMVRREEHPWEARATVVVDDRESAHAGHGSASSLETAVVIAASVAEHLDQRGYAVRLATAAGLVDAGTDQLSLLLEHLAVLGLRRRATLDVGWHHEPGRTGIVIGVFGRLTPEDALPLRRLRHGAAIAAAFALDTAQWAGRPAGAGGDNDAARALRDQGWRATSVGRSTGIEAAWRDLAAGAEVRR